MQCSQLRLSTGFAIVTTLVLAARMVSLGAQTPSDEDRLKIYRQLTGPYLVQLEKKAPDGRDMVLVLKVELRDGVLWLNTGQREWWRMSAEAEAVDRFSFKTLDSGPGTVAFTRNDKGKYTFVRLVLPDEQIDAKGLNDGQVGTATVKDGVVRIGG